MGQLDTGVLDRIPEDVHRICRRLRAAGWRAWIVGGCTRDLLLRRTVHDWDVATNAHPDDVVRLFPRVIPTGIQHGTVTVMQGRTGYEVTTLRGEGVYSDGRHPDSVTFVDELDADLARRDFTINAIALDPNSGQISDPFAGRLDLESRQIRAVGEPAQRFSEDGLRLMRAARFCATLEFTIEPSTLHAMASCAHCLKRISLERVRDELLKTMAAEHPSTGLDVMHCTGLLGLVFPEMLPMVNCEQNRYHRFDVWNHTLRVVDGCEQDPVLRLAAFLHDIGKPAVRGVNPTTGDYTFYHHEVVGAEMADRMGLRLRLSNDQRELVVFLVRNHLVVYDDEWTDAAVRRWVKRIGAERIKDVLAIARADALGKGTDESDLLAKLDRLGVRAEQILSQGMALSIRDLALDGTDLLQMSPMPAGPWVGRTLQHLLEAVLEEPAANCREELLSRARAFLREQGYDQAGC